MRAPSWVCGESRVTVTVGEITGGTRPGGPLAGALVGRRWCLHRADIAASPVGIEIQVPNHGA